MDYPSFLSILNNSHCITFLLNPSSKAIVSTPLQVSIYPKLDWVPSISRCQLLSYNFPSHLPVKCSDMKSESVMSNMT